MEKANTTSGYLKMVKVMVVAGILYAFPSLGQTPEQVAKQLAQYSAQRPVEKLYVHTDQNAYVAGSLLWFKVYAVEGTTNKPLSMSKVAYIDLIDANQTSILNAKVKLSASSGAGSVYLPVNLSSGNYRLRAYTSWMKNFGASFYFEKVITIVNPQKVIPATTTKPAYAIQFFPEGGALVEGIRSKIAFKLSGSLPKNSSWKGFIINNNNDTVARFAPVKFNIGSFSLMPLPSQSYRAFIRVTSGPAIQQTFPQVAAAGYVMHIVDDGSDLLKVHVNQKNATDKVFLLTHCRSVTKDVQTGAGVFQISKAKLGDGINHLTLFNAEGKPVCERLYFKRPEISLQITAAASEAQFSRRNKALLSISTKLNGNAISADLSAAVVKLEGVGPVESEDISSYLWLRADLQGYIESPGWYFKTRTAAADSALDNLLLTQGWRRFKWDDVLTNQKPVLSYLPEIAGQIITAKFTNNQTGEPASNIVGYLSVPGKRVQLATSKSDSAGLLRFETKDLYGSGEIVISANTQQDSIDRADMQTPFSNNFSAYRVPDYQVDVAQAAGITNANLGVQVQNVFYNTALKRYADPQADSTAFYGSHYTNYNLDDYTRFTTMEEVLREYVKNVLVTRPRNRFNIAIVSSNGILNTAPLLLLDGVPIFNIDKVFEIDPLKIKKIEVVNEDYLFVHSTYGGVISLFSYKGDMAGLETDPKALVIDYEGLQLQREFYTPVYDTEEQRKSRLPDFRTMLYWTPDAGTAASGKRQLTFYTSDQPGTYAGIVEGISNDGATGSATFTFEVK
ncbi:hypothetical protein [Mucilaginibacter sp. HD30]